MEFKIGDKVTVVNYGNAIWFNTSVEQVGDINGLSLLKKEGNIEWRDINKEVIGKSGVVDKVNISQGKTLYSIHGVGSWYSEKQLTLT